MLKNKRMNPVFILNQMLKQKRGFTIIELMVVAGILVISITALLGSIVASYRLLQSEINKAIAALDAQYVLEKLKSESFDALSSRTDINFTNLANESINVKVTQTGQKKIVNVTVNWIENGETRSFLLSTFFSL
ncbi:MAG: type II secretion system GspH family protein [Candidatus Omnitrophica bacterium]|nr:type II secretion system GspH family protein [Candidatus Omnitrophota bacterium]